MWVGPKCAQHRLGWIRPKVYLEYIQPLELQFVGSTGKGEQRKGQPEEVRPGPEGGTMAAVPLTGQMRGWGQFCPD